MYLNLSRTQINENSVFTQDVNSKYSAQTTDLSLIGNLLTLVIDRTLFKTKSLCDKVTQYS